MTQFSKDVADLIADLASRLKPAQREAFEERAGIREFDGGLPRYQAECLALLDVLREYPLALCPLTCLWVQQATDTTHVLTRDRRDSEPLLRFQGAEVLCSVDLGEVLEQFDGVLRLGPLG